MGAGIITDYVVGLDLALANTGWCVFTGGFPALWGTIVTSPKDTDSRRALRLKMALDDILGPRLGYGVFFVEKSEWHQNLSNPNWKKNYAIEREVQFTQGVAHGIFYLWAGERSVKYHDLPVGEWHKEFGSHDKTEIARLLSVQFPSVFRFGERVNRNGRKVHVLTSVADDKIVKDHESDAAAIALVGLNRLRAQDNLNHGVW